MHSKVAPVTHSLIDFKEENIIKSVSLHYILSHYVYIELSYKSLTKQSSLFE